MTLRTLTRPPSSPAGWAAWFAAYLVGSVLLVTALCWAIYP